MACTHPQRLGNMCACCGAHLGDADGGGVEKVAISGGTRAALQVTGAEASTLTAKRTARLETRRQLQLVLDLDHTLLECTTDGRAANLPPGEGVVALGPIAGRHHWVRLRPGLDAFFAAVAPLYELAIYTHGSREYADACRAAIEARCPSAKFGERVVSRDCCPDLRAEKSMERLFPGGAARALVLDDRLDVWMTGDDQTDRVVVVQPYGFFNRRLDVVEYRDGDAQLSHTARILEACHAAFYPESGPPLEDAAAALAAVAGAVFEGKRLYFRDRGDPATVRLAQRYGADIAETSADATHVVALERPAAGDAASYHLDWFWYCVWRGRAEPDAKYALPPMPGKRPRDEADAPPPEEEEEGEDSDDSDLADLEADLLS